MASLGVGVIKNAINLRFVINHLKSKGRLSPAIIPTRLRVAYMKDIMCGHASR